MSKKDPRTFVCLYTFYEAQTQFNFKSYAPFILRKRLLTSTVPVNNFLLTGTVPVNNSLLTGTVSNICGDVCAEGGAANYTFVFSLLYGKPAPSSECQHPEAWPASTYGHLREGHLRMKFLLNLKKGEMLSYEEV